MSGTEAPAAPAAPPQLRKRPQDWPDRLAAVVHDALDLPFVLGQHDCGRFACQVAEAITGRNPAPWLEGYTTEAELDALLAQHAAPAAEGSTASLLERAVAATMQAFGATEIPVLMAQRGDWVILQVGNEDLLAVVIGKDAVAPGPDRQRHVPVAKFAKRAWAI